MQALMFDCWGVKQVADCHYNTCVANVAALLKNREEGGLHWTAKSIQDEFGLVREANGKSNVGSVGAALTYIEEATDRSRSKTFANFKDARVAGDYAIFLNAHVIYGIIEADGSVGILDGNVGRGWLSWQQFLDYAATNKSLYGPNPALANQAFRLLKEQT
jgi:hypothetical protein